RRRAAAAHLDVAPVDRLIGSPRARAVAAPIGARQVKQVRCARRALAVVLHAHPKARRRPVEGASAFKAQRVRPRGHSSAALARIAQRAHLRELDLYSGGVVAELQVAMQRTVGLAPGLEAEVEL